ncbi:MAG: hypothetical protein KDB88_10765 [Flavobacteriales bacterium]|nr:hypothetical protein [Flavobacteriales bacterium]
MKVSYITLFAVPFVLVCLLGCRKELQFTDEGVALEFSQDSIRFDTVFTTLTTSVTRAFRVRNPSREAVRVDISLAGGSPSPFRINVDGTSGISFEDVEILGGDSIYVFVEVLPGASGVNTPFVVEDLVQFNTNGVEQEVLLQVWGQDALFYPNPDAPLNVVPGFPPFSYIVGGFDQNGNQICGEQEIWTAEKPIVLLNYAVVDSCNSLNIEPGARIYVHNGAGLWVYRNGRLTAQGTLEQRITFQGDRLEPEYQDLPGQWDRIWINEGSNGQDNVLEHCDIRNALIGVQCETFPLYPQEPTSEARLKLANTTIRNCSAAGILSRNYRIDAENLLVADCGQYCVALTGGGQYNFQHATIANYWSYDIRQTPAFILTNTYADINGNVQVREIEPSDFRNGIIYGNNGNEFELEIDPGVTPTYTFQHYLFRTDLPLDNTDHFPVPSNITKNQSPNFVSVSEGDLHLTSNSFAAIDKGDATGPLFDLDGELRGDGAPDLGCYEFVE